MGGRLKALKGFSKGGKAQWAATVTQLHSGSWRDVQFHIRKHPWGLWGCFQDIQLHWPTILASTCHRIPVTATWKLPIQIGSHFLKAFWGLWKPMEWVLVVTRPGSGSQKCFVLWHWALDCGSPHMGLTHNLRNYCAAKENAKLAQNCLIKRCPLSTHTKTDRWQTVSGQSDNQILSAYLGLDFPVTKFQKQHLSPAVNQTNKGCVIQKNSFYKVPNIFMGVV